MRYLLGLFFVWFCTDAVAGVPDYTIHHQYESARALGMGNAYTAVADDFSAIFYNPAGLTHLDEGDLNMFIQGMIDPDVIKFTKDIQDTSSSQNTTQMAQLLQNNYGKHYSSRVPSVGLVYARPNWGLAIIPLDLTLELDVHQTVGPAVSVVATQDTSIAYSHAWHLYRGKDQLTMGATLKGIYRVYYNRSLNALDLALDSNVLRKEDAQEGLTVDGDIGFMYKFFDPGSGFWHVFQPVLGLTVQNVGDANFSVANYHILNPGGSAPPKDQRRLNFGTTFRLPDWWVFHSHISADIRDVGHDNWTFKKGSHIGAEFNWKVRSWFQGGWRVGLNQGYWTAGFTGLFAVFQLDLSSFGEEVGPSSSPMESRRYMLRASLDF